MAKNEYELDEEEEKEEHEFWCTKCNRKVITKIPECPYCGNIIYFCYECYAQIPKDANQCLTCDEVF